MNAPKNTPQDITLITGGNRGLGYETARRLHTAGHTVIIGCRDRERGRSAASALGVEFVVLDVADPDTVLAATDEIRARYGRLDVLVNNAGIASPGVPVDQASADDAGNMMDINFLGIVRVTRAFLPLLARAANPRIVNVTSGLGSFARAHDDSTLEARVPPMMYAASKAAVNMLTVQYARALTQMRVNVADPGYTATDMTGGKEGGGQSVHDGTDAIITLATLPADGPTGSFIDRDGTVPW